MSARVIGTGFAVKSDFLMEIGGWSFESITEDADFFAACAAVVKNYLVQRCSDV